MRKMKVGDQVVVIQGKDKGRRGEILKFRGKDRCLVAGVRMVTKHVKPNPQAQTPGKIDRRESPVHISNLALLDEKTDKPGKVGFRFEEDSSGKRVKVRYFKSTGQTIE